MIQEYNISKCIAGNIKGMLLGTNVLLPIDEDPLCLASAISKIWHKNQYPKIWFDPKNADKEGPIAGKVLEYDKYNQLLDHYYDIRDWDKRGIPKKQTMKELDLEKEAAELEDHVFLE